MVYYPQDIAEWRVSISCSYIHEIEIGEDGILKNERRVWVNVSF